MHSRPSSRPTRSRTRHVWSPIILAGSDPEILAGHFPPSTFPGLREIAFSTQETLPVIDVMTRLKVHFMAMGGASHERIATSCEVGVRSVERILTEPVPTRDDLASGEPAGRPRRGRPSKADDALVAWVQAQLADDPRVLATEVLRRPRAEGYSGGRSAMSALVRRFRRR